MIDDTTTSTNKDVDSSSQLISLFIHRSSSIDGQDVVLTVVVFECVCFFTNLECKLTCGCKDHSKWLTFSEFLVLSEFLNHWKAEPESLARSSKVSYNQVFTTKNSPESRILDREQGCDTSINEATLTLL